ncbi:MAG: DUF4249 family protein [Bacteroidota bacterium]
MKTILFTGILLALSGCVKQTDWPVKEAAPQRIIVDAILTDEVKVQQVRLTYSVSQLNGEPRPVTGASVIISNEDSTWNLAGSTSSPGTFLTPAYFFAKPGKNYTLLISSDNKIYSAKASMVPGEFFQELRYTKDGEKNLYYIDWVANQFGVAGAAMWELKIDWSMVPGYTHLDSLANHARLLFYTLPTLDVSEVFAPQMESVYFPAGSVITERRYSLTPAHAEYIRELLLETNWTGGLFNVASANVTTNLSNGALGFFGVCAVNELSVTVAAGK